MHVPPLWSVECIIRGKTGFCLGIMLQTPGVLVRKPEILVGFPILKLPEVYKWGGVSRKKGFLDPFWRI